jgi:hypothetical protein
MLNDMWFGMPQGIWKADGDAGSLNNRRKATDAWGHCAFETSAL